MPRSGRARWLLHLVAWVVGIFAFRILLTPPENCSAPTSAEVAFAIDAAARWAVDGLDDADRFVYRYDREADSFSSDYNLVRHAGMVNALYQVAAAGRSEWLGGADRGLEFMLERLVDANGGMAFAISGAPAKIGATGLLIAGLHHRRLATGDQQYDDLMRAGGRFLVGQIEANGAPSSFWDPDLGPRRGTYSAFGTGEAMWGLSLLDETFPDERWQAPARRIGTYIATERREHEDLLLRIPDHWAAYGFAQLGGGTDEAEDEYLRRLSGDFGLMIRFESTRTGSGLSRLTRGDVALGAGVGALGEGLGALWRLSAVDPALGELRGALGERMLCTAGVLVDRQIGAEEASIDARPDVVAGAWFRQGVTQVDDQQHSLSALLAALDVLAEER